MEDQAGARNVSAGPWLIKAKVDKKYQWDSEEQ